MNFDEPELLISYGRNYVKDNNHFLHVLKLIKKNVVNDRTWRCEVIYSNCNNPGYIGDFIIEYLKPFSKSEFVKLRLLNG